MGSYIRLQGMGERRILFLIDERKITGRVAKRLNADTISLGEHINSLKCYEKVKNISPDNPFVYISIADMYIDISNTLMAIDTIKNEIIYNPDNYELLRILGDLYFATNNY